LRPPKSRFLHVWRFLEACALETQERKRKGDPTTGPDGKRFMDEYKSNLGDETVQKCNLQPFHSRGGGEKRLSEGDPKRSKDVASIQVWKRKPLYAGSNPSEPAVDNQGWVDMTHNGLPVIFL